MTTASRPDVRILEGGRRLMSVDALRGFDMFWIIAGEYLVSSLNSMAKSPVTQFLAYELDHAEWQGFHFYDLIFPLFVFIVGVSLVFSLNKAMETAGRHGAMVRVFRRSILLFVVALFYSGGFASPWPNIRLLGVLNRIALAYFFASLLFCYLKPRALIAVCAGLLVGYWALMTFVPIRDIQMTKASLAALAEKNGDTETAALFKEPGNPSTVKDSPVWAAAVRMFYSTTNVVTGKFDEGLNLSDHCDFRWLPGKKWEDFQDPEGYLSTIPAIATCLLGVFAGMLLRNQQVPDLKKITYLVSFGVAGVALGFLWGTQFPVVKKIWTSSFVLVAGGYSAILLAAFYLIVDVWQKRAWCQPFVWMGMNSITIYLASNIIRGFGSIAPRFVGGDVKSFLDSHVAQGMGSLANSIVGLLLAFWFVHFLYKRKIFLRL